MSTAVWLCRQPRQSRQQLLSFRTLCTLPPCVTLCASALHLTLDLPRCCLQPLGPTLAPHNQQNPVRWDTWIPQKVRTCHDLCHELCTKDVALIIHTGRSCNKEVYQFAYCISASNLICSLSSMLHACQPCDLDAQQAQCS